MNRTPQGAWVAMAVFTVAGLIFAAVSSYDFINHLDRQVHAITCSFVPGIGAPDTAGTSGCHVVMMSPYSAWFRTATWGGLPIAVPGIAVFAFLLFRIADQQLRRTTGEPGETLFTLLAAALPLVASVVYFGISVLAIGTVCKLCIGIYFSSLGAFGAAWWAHRNAVAGAAAAPKPWGRWALYVVEGFVFVLVPVLLYLGLKPAYPAQAAACGDLLHPEDRYGVRLKLTNPPGGVPAIEVLDPLCPACRAMSQRLEAGGYDERLAREAVLFPLDKECNWMVGQSVHPGACAASEAVLCAGPQVNQVLDFVFRHQEELRSLGAADPAKVTARLTQQFPQLAGCLGKPDVRARLNRSLRWAVANSLPVVTPQLFVRGEKVCDEDTDLGLEYVLSRKLATVPVTSGRAGR